MSRGLEKISEKYFSVFSDMLSEVNDMVENFDNLTTDPFLRSIWWNPGMIFSNKMKYYTDIRKPIQTLSPEELKEKNTMEAVMQRLNRLFDETIRQLEK